MELVDNTKEAVVFAAVGAAVGGIIVYETVGNMGLAFRGIAIAIGRPAFIATGAVVGVAAYGLKKSVVG